MPYIIATKKVTFDMPWEYRVLIAMFQLTIRDLHDADPDVVRKAKKWLKSKEFEFWAGLLGDYRDIRERIIKAN